MKCVKLWNVEETTLFEDIQMVRDASERILGLHVDWHPHHDTDWHSCHQRSQTYVTYACNSASTDLYDRSCSLDIGYVVTQSNSILDVETVYDAGERDLGLETNDYDTMIFDMNYDDDINFDDRYEYDLCLL